MKLTRQEWQTLIIVEVLLAVYFAAMATWHLRPQEAPFVSAQLLPIKLILSRDNRRIHLELATTPEQLSVGLQHRPPLPADRGMYFQFPERQVAKLWMKNVNSPLDVVYLTRGKIVELKADLAPCRTEDCPIYPSREPIDAAIELPAGTIAKWGFKLGDRPKIITLDRAITGANYASETARQLD